MDMKDMNLRMLSRNYETVIHNNDLRQTMYCPLEHSYSGKPFVLNAFLRDIHAGEEIEEITQDGRTYYTTRNIKHSLVPNETPGWTLCLAKK